MYAISYYVADLLNLLLNTHVKILFFWFCPQMDCVQRNTQQIGKWKLVVQQIALLLLYIMDINADICIINKNMEDTEFTIVKCWPPNYSPNTIYTYRLVLSWLV